jgi:hypothetical protein
VSDRARVPDTLGSGLARLAHAHGEVVDVGDGGVDPGSAGFGELAAFLRVSAT